MKYLKCYNTLFNCKNSDEVFSYFLKNLKVSNNSWNYFVNWEKVFNNVRDIEINLNIFNYLIGKQNFDEEFKALLKAHPEIIEVIPLLLVSRENKFDILVDFSKKKLVYEHFNFSRANLSDSEINRALVFVKETGLKDLFLSGKIKSLVDYMVGVEAGLDSNGRKNRGGDSMENIVEVFIKDLCKRKSFNFLKEADASKIKEEFGIDVPVDKSSRRYDFVVKTNKELVIFEVNFYGGGGSKLKSTAGEYRNLYDVLEGKFKFIWITDGFGWKNTSRPLQETFEHNDYLLSLAMLEKGILDELL